MPYKSTRRQWVKLWVNEWLDGTTRFSLTANQRLLWVDLLALAGRSRFPGYIYAGEGERGAKVGYPVAYLAGILQMDEVTLNNALKLLLSHGHITLEETSSDQFVIGIVNWEKYQSEYLRQKAYRKVTTHATRRLLVEGEKGENSAPPLPPAGAGGEIFFRWQRQTIGVFASPKKRLFTEREKQGLQGARAEDVVEQLNRKGFRARLVE